MLLTVVMVLCFAGFTQGVSGFGFGLVAMALLPMVVGLKDAVALLVPLNLIVCGITFYSVRKHYAWRDGLGLVVGVCLGVPVGVYALNKLPEGLLLRTLGLVMLLFSLREFLSRSATIPRRLEIPLGFISGGLSGAFNMGGPPVIAFTYSQTWRKEQVVAVLQVVFGISATLRLLLLGSAGLLTRSLMAVALTAAVPLILAITMGNRLLDSIPQRALKTTTFAFLGVMGLRYLFW